MGVLANVMLTIKSFSLEINRSMEPTPALGNSYKYTKPVKCICPYVCYTNVNDGRITKVELSEIPLTGV